MAVGGLSTNRIRIGRGRTAASFISNLITQTITFDPPSLATVTGATSSGITMTGAKLGDRVDLFPPYDTQGIQFQGYVSVANQIKISLFNPTAGTIDLASGSWIVQVIRP